MDEFDEQIERIKIKLSLAKRIDKNYEVFGSSRHKYKIGDVISKEVITRFESKYQIELPKCYSKFLTEVGNGGVSYEKSAAGPFYGIFPFGKNIHELVEYPEKYLSKKVKIYPKMTDEYWKNINKNLSDIEEMTDEEYEEEVGEIFSGILPLGSQGCTYLHGMILNGEDSGKVVNLDISRQKPKFSKETNFLDWYERWQDEIITGELMRKGTDWFGYSKRNIKIISLSEARSMHKKKWYEIWK